MVIEDRFKQVIGDLVFQNIALQHRVEELEKEKKDEPSRPEQD